MTQPAEWRACVKRLCERITGQSHVQCNTKELSPPAFIRVVPAFSSEYAHGLRNERASLHYEDVRVDDGDPNPFAHEYGEEGEEEEGEEEDYIYTPGRPGPLWPGDYEDAEGTCGHDDDLARFLRDEDDEDEAMEYTHMYD